LKLRAVAFAAWRLLTGPAGSGRRKRHALGAILGVAFSLVPLIVVQQVSSGMIEGISRRFLEIGSFHLQARSFQNGDETFEEIARRISAHPGVRLAVPVVEGLGIVYSPDGRSGVSVRGLPEDWLEKDEYAASFLQWIEGEYRLSGRSDVLISREAARNLNVGVGDSITLLTSYSSGRGTIMKPTRFTVAGVFSTGYYELDALSLYIPYERALSLFPESWSSIVGIKIDDPYGTYSDIKNALYEIVPSNWRIYSWYELQRPMFESFRTTRTLLVFIMMLIVMVASVSITSAVVMMVLEHEAELAMLKSTGVSSAGIEQLFLFLGFLIGGSGAVIGSALGLLLSININGIIRGMEWAAGNLGGLLMFPFGYISGSSPERLVIFNPDYYLENIPVHIQYGEILYAALFALVFALAGSYFPARKAGRMKPLEIFRKH
jgi:lipoprotein-releasing system permease protein